MYTFTTEQRRLFASDPLLSSLAPIRDALQQDDEQRNNAQSAQDVTGRKDTLKSLIRALLEHPVARQLSLSRYPFPQLKSELALVFFDLDTDKIDLSTFDALVHVIADEQSDETIWTEAIKVVDACSTTTPPRSAPASSVLPSYDGTPRTGSSKSHKGSEETRRILEPAMREELWDKIYEGVEGFFEKFFEQTSWASKSEEIFRSMKHGHINDRWSYFPSSRNEQDVWRWWSDIQEKHLQGLRGTWYTTSGPKQLTGSDNQRQLDLFVKHCDVSSGDTHDWSDVRVVGEHKSSDTDRAAKFWQLAIYVREIFKKQPIRRRVHAFLLLGSSMELYVFDRSGVYGATPFDIHKEPERFVRVLTGYVLMSDEELGLDTFIKTENGKQFVTLNDDRSEKRKTFELETPPMFVQRAIVCRGTTCFHTTDGEHVVKFSWRSTKRCPETDFLRKARDRGVKGVAQINGFETVTSIAELRDGLTFIKRRKFQDPSQTSRSPLGGSPLGGSQSSAAHVHIKSLSLQESKRRLGDISPRPEKKSRSSSRASVLSQKYTAENDPLDTTVQELQNVETESSQMEALIDQENDKFRDRVLSCIAISPAGRPLQKFRNILELLRCIRDTIKAHRSLYINGKILHRDISDNNIIITDPEKADGFYGTLIDFDMAAYVGESGKNYRSGANQMTGTLKYMAIEVVYQGFSKNRRNFAHTYRHDLESFFYVFLDVCINYRRLTTWPDPLRGWYVGTYSDIAAMKHGHMGEGGFERLVLPNFLPTFKCLKDLARSLRDILFQKDKLVLHTPLEADPLYNDMIQAFDDTIQELH